MRRELKEPLRRHHHQHLIVHCWNRPLFICRKNERLRAYLYHFGQAGSYRASFRLFLILAAKWFTLTTLSWLVTNRILSLAPRRQLNVLIVIINYFIFIVTINDLLFPFLFISFFFPFLYIQIFSQGWR